jgi:NAD(P)-dependent dehydrogenase (short-subunit alcohol dehydrogenase family)
MDIMENSDPVLRDPYLSKGKVVVITGASSGIGRATAHEFARRGANVVVSSRNKIALDEVVDECRLHGGEAMAVAADVTREQEVNDLAQAAIKEYGRIDIWVNNAAVTLFGRFEEVPTADIRQVIETNLFGYIYGARAVIPHFRDQGSGVLINLSSIVAVTGQPYTGAYVATKAAERALSESLSQELSDEKNIRVCTVLPAVIDTPLFQHGGNYMGKEAIPPKPVHPPEMVAMAIADISENPRKEIFVGSPGPWMYVAKVVTPTRLYDKMVKKNIEKNHFRDTITDLSPGNLYDYALDQVSGGWREQMFEEGPDVKMNAGMVLAGALFALLAVWGLRRSKVS